jgi:uncharacterized protein (TIGR03083 family)
MGTLEIWPVVHVEREALAGDLRGLAEDRWATPSLCDEWTVRDVLAHMTAAAKITPPSFFGKLAAAGFRFERLQQTGVARERGSSPADTLARFVTVRSAVKHPPGPADAMLGETIIHAQDIRGSLGIQHEYPTEAVVRLADFFKGSNLLIGAKRRISGFSLRATDADWQHGAGPGVTGPILSLVMAMTGRKAAIDDLTGDGVPALRARP